MWRDKKGEIAGHRIPNFAKFDYEEAPAYHLIDVESGEVIEFVNEEIEKLQDKVAKKLGYELTGHRLELYGKKL